MKKSLLLIGLTLLIKSPSMFAGEMRFSSLKDLASLTKHDQAIRQIQLTQNSMKQIREEVSLENKKTFETIQDSLRSSLSQPLLDSVLEVYNETYALHATFFKESGFASNTSEKDIQLLLSKVEEIRDSFQDDISNANNNRHAIKSIEGEIEKEIDSICANDTSLFKSGLVARETCYEVGSNIYGNFYKYHNAADISDYRSTLAHFSRSSIDLDGIVLDFKTDYKYMSAHVSNYTRLTIERLKDPAVIEALEKMYNNGKLTLVTLEKTYSDEFMYKKSEVKGRTILTVMLIQNVSVARAFLGGGLSRELFGTVGAVDMFLNQDIEKSKFHKR